MLSWYHLCCCFLPAFSFSPGVSFSTSKLTLRDRHEKGEDIGIPIQCYVPKVFGVQNTRYTRDITLEHSQEIEAVMHRSWPTFSQVLPLSLLFTRTIELYSFKRSIWTCVQDLKSSPEAGAIALRP